MLKKKREVPPKPKQSNKEKPKKKSFWRRKGFITLVTGVVASLIAAIIVALVSTSLQHSCNTSRPVPGIEDSPQIVSDKTNNQKKKILQAQFSLYLSERIKIESDLTFLLPPHSFCVTEDNVFLIPNSQIGTIMVFEKDVNNLYFRKLLRLNISNLEKKDRLTCCSYSQNEQNEERFGVIYEGTKKIFIFNKTGKLDFSLSNEIACEKFGYDIKFANDGERLIVSGLLNEDKSKKDCDLYSINIQTGQTEDCLLPSNEKYGFKTYEKYEAEYFNIQKLPAIGIKGFFDIQGDDLFYVWEGALRIINLGLRSKEIKRIFGQETDYYIKPDGSQLNDFYIIKEYLFTWKDQDMFAYVRNIFVTFRHVFLVYEADKTHIINGSRFRLQIYTQNGQFLGDVSIPENPSLPMWLDKENYELYAFSQKPKNDNTSFSILKYKIKI